MVHICSLYLSSIYDNDHFININNLLNTIFPKESVINYSFWYVHTCKRKNTGLWFVIPSKYTYRFITASEKINNNHDKYNCNRKCSYKTKLYSLFSDPVWAKCPTTQRYIITMETSLKILEVLLMPLNITEKLSGRWNLSTFNHRFLVFILFSLWYNIHS